jgi:DNA-binding MurR/RpiR family transcriptional regulator
MAHPFQTPKVTGIYVPFTELATPWQLWLLSVWVVTQEQRTEDHERDVLELVRAQKFEFSAAERRVAELVLHDPDGVLSMSAARLALASGSSVGTVVRFCRTLGLDGFQTFKHQLTATRLGLVRTEILGATEPINPPDDVLHRTLTNLSRAIASVDVRLIERAGLAIKRADRVHICGSGPSLRITTAFGGLLGRAGLNCSYPDDTDTQAAIAGQLTLRDICFAVSHSGTTSSTLHPAQLAVAAGAPLVVLTSFSGSPLAKLGDLTIVAGAPEDPYRNADTASRTVHLAIVQAMASVIADAPAPPRPGTAPLGPVTSSSQSQLVSQASVVSRSATDPIAIDPGTRRTTI